MAETRPTAAPAKANTSVQPKKSSNAISYLAPIICIIAGYVIWRFILGNSDNFTKPDMSGGFWPSHKGPKSGFYRMYEGGIIVPLLMGLFLMVVTFSIERYLTISKATPVPVPLQSSSARCSTTWPTRMWTQPWPNATSRKVPLVMS